MIAVIEDAVIEDAVIAAAVSDVFGKTLESEPTYGRKPKIRHDG